MLNTYDNRSTQTITMPPTCAGTLQKTFRKSWFRRFHLTSDYAKRLFEPEYQQSKIVILQIMSFGDSEFLAELANKDDYDAIFGGEE